MHYYIDESGIFRNPQNKNNTVSCLGALVIPSTKKKDIFKAFKLLTSKWRGKDDEIKGKNLDESQISQIVQLLKRFDVLFEAVAIDLGFHSEEEISEFKRISAEKFTESLTPEHHQEVVDQAKEIQDVFAGMSNSVFIQSIIMFDLIPRTLHHSLLYYARRIPKELQWFYWVMDAKENQITQAEKAWSVGIYPVMSKQSLDRPIFFVEGGEYKYFNKFYKTDKDYIKTIEEEGNFAPDEIKAIKLWEIIGKNFKFQNSKENIGLQIVDVLVNATQRALNGKLRQSGWTDIGNLIVRLNPSPLQVVAIKPDKKANENTRNFKAPY